MGVVVLACVCAGAGVALFLRAVFAPVPRLRDLEAGQLRPTGRVASSDDGPFVSLSRTLVAWLPEEQVFLGDITADLRILRKSLSAHVAEKVMVAGAAAVAPFAFWVLMALGPQVSVPMPVVLVAAVACAVGGFMFPDVALRDQAREARDDFISAFASYLDLCRILLGASDGPESALEKAAAIGEGWPFHEIRSALLLAKGDASIRHWDALSQLGDEIDVRELREFAAAMSATATSASQPATLAARAENLRDKTLASIAGEAEAATEKMDMPNSLLAMAFTVFILYASLFVTQGGNSPIDPGAPSLQERDQTGSVQTTTVADDGVGFLRGN